MKNHLHLQNMTEIPRICAEQYKNRKKFLRFLLTCVIISKISIWMMNGYSLQLVLGDGGFVKRYVVKSSLQRPLHDQILSYQSMLDLCVREIPSITFFGVGQEEMVNVRAGLKDHFAKSKTVPWRRSSHFCTNILQQNCSQITSEDRQFLQFNFDDHWVKK